MRGLITPRASFLSMLFGGGGGLMSFRQALREAIANDDITAIVLDVDSPGGSTDLLSETAAAIRAAREVKPSSRSRTRGPRRPPTGSPRRPTSSSSRRPARSARSACSPCTRTGRSSTTSSASRRPDLRRQVQDRGQPVRAAQRRGARRDAGDDRRVLRHVRRRRREGPRRRGRRPQAATARAGCSPRSTALAEGMADRVDTLEATIARVVRAPEPRPPQGAARPPRRPRTFPRATPSPTRLRRRGGDGQAQPGVHRLDDRRRALATRRASAA
jgi:hypothetical protein